MQARLCSFESPMLALSQKGLPWGSAQHRPHFRKNLTKCGSYPGSQPAGHCNHNEGGHQRILDQILSALVGSKPPHPPIDCRYSRHVVLASRPQLVRLHSGPFSTPEQE